MREQVSNKALQLRIDWLNQALARPAVPYSKRADGKTTPNVGSFYAEREAGGGWRIYETEAQGARPVFGTHKWRKIELFELLEAVLESIRLARVRPASKRRG